MIEYSDFSKNDANLAILRFFHQALIENRLFELNFNHNNKPSLALVKKIHREMERKLEEDKMIMRAETMRRDAMDMLVSLI